MVFGSIKIKIVANFSLSSQGFAFLPEGGGAMFLKFCV